MDSEDNLPTINNIVLVLLIALVTLLSVGEIMWVFRDRFSTYIAKKIGYP